MSPKATAPRAEAQIEREYGPFPEIDCVHGVTFDGSSVWFATDDGLRSFDPATGREGRKLPVRASAGTAYDGRHFYQISGESIVQLDAKTGNVLASVPAPKGSAGLTWAEGTLWVGVHRERKIHQIDPRTGAVLRTLDAARFVTGVTFVEGDLWYGTWEGNESDLRRADPKTGEVLESIAMPAGAFVSGLEYDGVDTFYCGAANAGKVRAIRRTKRRAAV